MEKRGVSHIEVILAFVLFMGFVGFAIYFFNPLKNPIVGETFSKSAFNEIIKNSSTEVVSYSIKILSDPLPNIVAINISDLGPGMNALAENYDGNRLNAEIENRLVYVQINGNNFIVIKFNAEFVPETISEHPLLDESFYDIASVNSERLVSKAKILQMNKSYYSDAGYDSLKNSLKIQKEKSFGFRMIFDESYSINAEIADFSKSEVFAYEEKVKVLAQNGEIKFANLIVKTW